MPIFNVTVESPDDKAEEDIEVTGLEIKDLTTIKKAWFEKIEKKGFITKKTKSSIWQKQETTSCT